MHGGVQGGRAAADRHAMTGSGKSGHCLFKPADHRPGGEPVGTKDLDYRLNVILADLLAAIGNKRSAVLRSLPGDIRVFSHEEPHHATALMGVLREEDFSSP
jgi:hypothetical protein